MLMLKLIRMWSIEVKLALLIAITQLVQLHSHFVLPFTALVATTTSSPSIAKNVEHSRTGTRGFKTIVLLTHACTGKIGNYRKVF